MSTGLTTYSAGSGHAGAKLVPGIPFLKRGMFSNTGSATEVGIGFPSLANGFTVVNESTNPSGTIMRIHFSTRTGNSAVVNESSGNIGCNVKLEVGESVSLATLCNSVYISRDAMATGSVSYYTLFAQLTGIKHPSFALSGSGINL